MATRLPIPGSDNNKWGDILNDFLSQAHNTDGSLKAAAVSAAGGGSATIADNSVTTAKVANGAITNAKLDTPTQAVLTQAASAYVKPAGGVPSSDLASAVQTSLSKADSALQTAPVTSVAGKTGAVTLAASDVGAVATSQVGAASGVASLDSGTKVPTAQIPDLSTSYTALTTAGKSALNLTDYQKLLPWYAALANRKSKRVNVIVMGDSIIEGYPMSSFDRSVSAYLASILRARHPVAGVTGGRGYIGSPSSFFTTGDPGVWPLAYTGGTFDSTTYGFGAKHIIWYSPTAGNKIVDTLAAPVTSFDINLMLNTAGAAAAGYYKIDGGAAVNFTTFANPNQSSTLHVASPATTSIEIGVNSGGHYLDFEGITEYNGDENAGITCHNCGYSGYTAGTWNVKNTVWPLSQKLLMPDLLIISLGANDASTVAGNRTSAQFQSDLTTLIAAQRAAGNTCPIVLSMMWDSPVTKVEPWINYVNVAKAIAVADSTVICVDHSARMPAAGSTQGTALGLYYTDQAHGNANGNAYAYTAETLYAAIAPR